MKKQQVLRKLAQSNDELKKFVDYIKSTDFKDVASPEWNVEEVLMHIYTTEELSHKYLSYKISQGASFRKLRISDTMKFKLFLWKANGTPKMKAPSIVDVHRDQIDIDKNQIVDNWLKMRSKIYSLLEELKEEDYKKAMYKHSFGRFSLAQMVEFFDYHTKRHKKQIQNLEP